MTFFRLADRFQRAILLAGICALSAMGNAATQVTVDAATTMNIGNGELDLCCADILIAGRIELANGKIRNARTITIAPTGTLVAGNGDIEIGGSFQNTGNFQAGASTVRFVDLPCAVPNRSISGSNQFATLIVASAIGQSLAFPAGLTQIVTTRLELNGTPAIALPLLGTPAGQPWNLNLVPGATQSISNVAVADSIATGQHLAPNDTNRGTGSAIGWFAQVILEVPLNITALLTILVTLVGFGNLRRRYLHARNTRN